MNYIINTIKNDIKEKMSCFVLTILYLLGTIIYIIHLNILNDELKAFTSTGIQNAIDVITYKNGIAMKFFIVALAIVIIGLGIIVYLMASRLEVALYLLIAYIVLIIVCIIAIIVFINNPILKSILIVTCGLGGVFFAYTN